MAKAISASSKALKVLVAGFLSILITIVFTSCSANQPKELESDPILDIELSLDYLSPNDYVHDDYVGTWVNSAMRIDGETVTMGNLPDKFAGFGISIAGNGNAYVTLNGDMYSGRYSTTGDYVEITSLTDGSELILYLAKNYLVLSIDDASGKLRDILVSSNCSTVIFERTSTQGNGDFKKYVGHWNGYDALAMNLYDLSEIQYSTPVLMSDADIESTISVNEDMTGEYMLEWSGDLLQCDIVLEPSDKTQSYMVYGKDGEEYYLLATLEYSRSDDNSDWLVMTVYDSLETGDAFMFTYYKD